MSLTDISFTRILKAGERLREFNFRKLPKGENLFHVDFTDDRGQRVLFTMQPDGEGAWRIVEQDKPKWLYFSESILGEVLNEAR